jgi:hypothetical protein
VRTAVSVVADDSTPEDDTDGLAWTGVTAVEEMIIAGVALFALGFGLLYLVSRRRRNE